MDGKIYIADGRIGETMMDNDEWEIETQRRAGLVAEYFSPKEILAIQDFITTAKDVSKEE